MEYFATATSAGTNPAAFLHEVKLDDDTKGELRVLGAGRMDATYLRELAALDWQRLLAPARFIDPRGQVTLGTGSLFEKFCMDLAPLADAIFIDAPTGLNDTSNVCLRRLADLVVAVFTPSRVQVEGVGRIVSVLAEQEAATGKPGVLCVASTLHAHRLTLEQVKRVDQAFGYLEAVRFEALGRPALDDPEKLDAIEQPRVHIPYEPAFADLDEIRLAVAPDKNDLALYEDLVRSLGEAVPHRSLAKPVPEAPLDPGEKRRLVNELLPQFPPPVAEQETDPEAFLRTNHVRAVLDPTTVLVHGGKGSGKTASCPESR